MHPLKQQYQNQQAPHGLQPRLMADYQQAQKQPASRLLPAAAFAVLLAGVSAVWLYQPSAPTPSVELALESPALRLNASVAGVSGLTAQTSSFSRLSLSQLNAPVTSQLGSLPSVPQTPSRPSI